MAGNSIGKGVNGHSLPRDWFIPSATDERALFLFSCSIVHGLDLHSQHLLTRPAYLPLKHADEA